MICKQASRLTSWNALAIVSLDETDCCDAFMISIMLIIKGSDSLETLVH